MNFVEALLHASAGYDIRRKAWVKGKGLRLFPKGVLHWEGREIAELLGGGPGDLTVEDIKATDWTLVPKELGNLVYS